MPAFEAAGVVLLFLGSFTVVAWYRAIAEHRRRQAQRERDEGEHPSVAATSGSTSAVPAPYRGWTNRHGAVMLHSPVETVAGSVQTGAFLSGLLLVAAAARGGGSGVAHTRNASDPAGDTERGVQGMKSLQLAVPDDLYAALGEAELRALAQEALVVRLYALGQLGSGRAAQLLGVSRRAFLTDVLGRYAVSGFDEDVDLATELTRG